MNGDIRGLLDQIDEDSRDQAELEQSVSVLKNEITTLKLVIEDQKVIIDNMNRELKDRSDVLPENLQLLKDIIIAQRREITQKDKDLEIMRILVEKFTGELEAAIIAKFSEYQLIDVPGIGPKNSAKLVEAGIKSVVQLKNCNVEELAEKIEGIGIKKLKKWKTYLIKRSEHISFHYI
jgi:DNA uptake protein ComE-like DNA-binding protein